MKRLSCIIIDDEAIARKALEKYIAQVEELELLHTFRNGMEAKAWLSKNKVDLLFLDINMPYLNGLELLRVLKDNPPVIFTTAYSEHALESFEFNVIDYIVKPIPLERFLQSVNKALRFMELKSQAAEKFLVIKEDSSIVKIKIKDILYVEAMQNYVRIYTKTTSHLTLMALKELRRQLPENDFTQVHRSYLVQLSMVERLDREELIIGDHRVPVSKRNKTKVAQLFREL